MISGEVLEKLEFNKILKFISNYCVTELGKLEVESIKPQTKIDTILYECKLVEEAKTFLINFGNSPIEFLPDLREDLYRTKIEGSFLNTKKILEIKKLATVSRILRNTFLKDERFPLLRDIVNDLISDKNFENQIDRVLTPEGEIKTSASPELQKIRKEIISKKEELTKAISRIIKRLKDDDYVREDYLTLRDGRMVIPIKAEHKRHIKGFIHSESSTGQTVYIEPEETLELNNDIVSLFFAEQREVERILRELTKIVGDKSGDLIKSLNIISKLDSVLARANYSIEIMGCLPKLDLDKPLHIIEARHPLLIKKLGRNNTVPLDLKLEDEKVIIITGPNAGGKTVVLKTIGLLVLMLQSGIHIPVNPDSNFNIFEKILIDIGDQQSIEDDLSTFSSHLKNLKSIFELADSKSLILLDEIGTGTDPTEGSALAIALLKELYKKSALTFATTHHGNLKIFAFEEKGFNNASMQFDHKNLTPTYKFKLGIPGSSYAFEVAEKSGLAKHIIDTARAYIDIGKNNLEKFIAEIEAKSFELEKKLNQVELENLRLKSLSELYKKSYEKIEKEKNEIIKKTKVEAEKFLQDINKKFEKAVKQVKESNAEKSSIKDGKKIIEEIKSEVSQFDFINSNKIDVENNFNIGDFVSIKNSNSIGKIIEINKEKKRATVLIGSIKILANLDELQKTKSIKEVENETTSILPNPNVKYRLDIRGRRVNDAEFDIIKFIDDAYQFGYDRVEILHGKGTGALKKLVNEILSSHIGIKNFYYAPIEYGGDGITIVEFK
ncbi:MAG: endonuclease MutS2 [Ignavibacterium sp.]|nr:endonuclease MutS2 [Ignavibacterium sp.]MDW8375237.1 endonuclease MutS2 [Ignavibacteriales bacterium]